MNHIDAYYQLQYFQNRCRLLAQKYFSYSAYIKYCIIAISAIYVFINAKYSWVLILASCIAEIAMQYLQKKGFDYHKKSRVAAQATLFCNSFNSIHSITIYEEILADDEIMKDYDVSKVNKSYYNSVEKKGVRRYAYNIAESILYSKYLLLKYEKKKQIEMVLVMLGCFSLIITALIIIDNNRFLIVTPITSILIFLVYGEIDDYFDLVKANKRMEVLDNTLNSKLKNGEYDQFALYTLYNEYSQLTRETLPVPTPLYLKHRDTIFTLWQTRYTEAQRASTENLLNDREVMSKIQISGNFGSVQGEIVRNIAVVLWKYIEDQYGNCEKLNVERVSSFSRSLIIKLTFTLRESQEKVRIIAKRFPFETDYNKTLQFFKNVKEIDSSHYPEYIDNDELRNLMVMAYYHVNTMTQAQYSSLDYILGTNEWDKKDKLYLKQLNAAIAFNYDMLNKEDLVSLFTLSKQQMWDEFCQRRPGSFVIDLSWIDKLTPSGKIIYDKQRAIVFEAGSVLTFADQMGRSSVKLLNWNDNERTVGIINYGIEKYMVLLPISEGYAANNYIDIDFSTIDNIKVLYTLEKFLELQLKVQIKDNLSSDYDTVIEKLKDCSNDWEWHLSHNDFHAKNIFISEDDYKIIDIENIGYNNPYADICRLQLSFLYYYYKGKSDPEIVNDFFASLLKGEPGDGITKTIHSLKTNYSVLMGHSFSDEQYRLSLLLELLMQLYYCICSDRKLTDVWVVGYHNMKEILIKND